MREKTHIRHFLAFHSLFAGAAAKPARPDPGIVKETTGIVDRLAMLQILYHTFESKTIVAVLSYTVCTAK